MKVTEVPEGAINLNVDGHELASPLRGFGSLWQKTFRIRLTGTDLTPAEVMKIWKANFPKFHPAESRFHPSTAGIQPGEIILIDGKVPPVAGMPNIMPVAGGVMVMYSDDVSFSVVTPVGFPESGWNTFSVFEEDGALIAQVQTMARAADPLYEFFHRFLGSSKAQDKIWTHVLTSLAAHLGIQEEVTVKKTLIDPSVRWSEAGNIFKNGAARTVFYQMGAPLRWITRKIRRPAGTASEH
jgi:hypothetical protein